jgi:hypothetical protein
VTNPLHLSRLTIAVARYAQIGNSSDLRKSHDRPEVLVFAVYASQLMVTNQAASFTGSRPQFIILRTYLGLVTFDLFMVPMIPFQIAEANRR